MEKLKSNIPALTGIRFIAALMVLVEHLAPPTGIPFLDSAIKELDAGVTIFFVLSGFLISYRYFDNYSDGKLWKTDYFVNRAARIYPMYFLVTCFTFVFLYKTTPAGEFPKTLFLNLTLLRGFSDKYVYSGIPQGWTLSVEEVFYTLAPIIFFLSRKIPLYLQSLLLLIMGFLLLYLSGLMVPNFVMICTFFGRSFEFMCGIYLFLIIRNNSFKPRIKVTFPAVLLVGALLFIMSRLSYAPYKYGIQNPIGLAINNYVIPVAIALLFWGLIHERSALQRLLSTRVFEVLGKSSYTLYLIHYGPLTFLIKTYVSHNFFVKYLIIQVCAIIAWRYIEEPLNHRIRKAFHRRKDPQLIMTIVKP